MKCPNCGGTQFAKFIDRYECIFCGEPLTDFENQEKDFQADNKDCASFDNIVRCLEAPRLNEVELKRHLDDLSSQLPGNEIVLCLFAYLSRKNYPENLKTSISNLCQYDFKGEEDKWLFPFLVWHLEYKYFDAITDVLLKKDLFRTYSQQLDDAKRQLESENELYANKTRDVFVCYSSNDLTMVEQIVDRLEADANSCWYAKRNLPQNSLSTTEYKIAIENAIKQCDIFLVVMSQNSLLSNDVIWELEMADKYSKNNRIEYRIENVNNTSVFKNFFDGYQWIDAAESTQYYLLLQRVYAMKHASKPKEPEDASWSSQQESTLKPNSDMPKEFWGDIEYGMNDSEEIGDDDRSEMDDDDLDNNDYDSNSLDSTSAKVEDNNYESEALVLFENQCYEEAFQLLEKNEEQPTESLTYYYIAFCFENGYGTDIDVDKAKEIYELSESVNFGTDEHLGEYYYLIGKKYAKGETVSQNSERAFEMFKKSAELGNGFGMCNLGICYKSGFGTAKDEDNAFETFNLAKEVYPKEAYYQLGLCYEKGLGVRFDDKKAVECFEIAAAQGHEKAVCNLGVHYYYGTGIEQDYSKAVEYYKMAGESGDAIALYNLAQCYYNGTGVEQDRQIAKELLQESADKGNKKAAHFLIDNY